MSISPKDLDQIYAFAIQLGKDAGQMLLDGVEKRCGDGGGGLEADEHVEKMNAVDIVTKMDNGVYSPESGVRKENISVG